MVVGNEDGSTELVAEVVDGVLELRIGVLGGEGRQQVELLLFATPSSNDLPKGVGAQLWANGEVMADWSWWADC